MSEFRKLILQYAEVVEKIDNLKKESDRIENLMREEVAREISSGEVVISSLPFPSNSFHRKFLPKQAGETLVAILQMGGIGIRRDDLARKLGIPGPTAANRIKRLFDDGILVRDSLGSYSASEEYR